MSLALQLVKTLLEADEPPAVNIEPEDVNPEQFITHHADELDREKERDRASGVVNPRTALTAQYFWHKAIKRSDGRTSVGVRRNGSTKTWKTRPGEFRIPVKYGMYEYFYITDKNADEWTTIEPEPLPKPTKVKKPKPVISPSSLMPDMQAQLPPPPDHPELPL
jgi:hypothetical protein